MSSRFRDTDARTKQTSTKQTSTKQKGFTFDGTGGTTPVPTILLDRVMPDLRDTELRVLLVVVRQTLGWQVGKDPHLRKERDWLTQSQLMRRTGRASGAVARAIDALIQRGLIDVLDASERPLDTPAERRRHLGRLYYRLHRKTEVTEAETKHAGIGKSEYAKPHTTKTTRYKNTNTVNRNVDKIVDKPVVVLTNSGWTRAAVMCSRERDQEPQYLLSQRE